MNTFFELIQVAVGTRSTLSCSPSAEQWQEVYETAKKQALIGICFAGVERLARSTDSGQTKAEEGRGQLPPSKMIRQWAIKANKIRDINKVADEDCQKVLRFFKENGFETVILKGQSNYAYYPEWLQGLRSPGDIDVWAMPKKEKGKRKEEKDGPVKSVIEFCQSKVKSGYVYYHNMDFPILKTTEVEVHYRPTFLYCPWRNRRLQRWIASFQGLPSLQGRAGERLLEFNVVFQLLHLYKHIFEEGIGLRQLVDYFWCLNAYSKLKETDESAFVGMQSRTDKIIRELKLNRFCGAVMYVMQEVFRMPREMMLCEPTEKDGRLLLDEIMIGGNFGQHDARYKWAEVTNGSMEYRGMGYALTRLKHNYRFLRSYPEEVIWEPLFRVYHMLWRKLKLWRYE